LENLNNRKMNTNQILNKVRVLLGMEVKLEQMKLGDGVTVLEAEMFEAGNEVFVVTEDEQKIPVPVGEYELEDGRILVVVEEGIIAEIKEKEVEEEEVEEVEILRCVVFQKLIFKKLGDRQTFVQPLAEGRALLTHLCFLPFKADDNTRLCGEMVRRNFQVHGCGNAFVDTPGHVEF